MSCIFFSNSRSKINLNNNIIDFNSLINYSNEKNHRFSFKCYVNINKSRPSEAEICNLKLSKARVQIQEKKTESKLFG